MTMGFLDTMYGNATTQAWLLSETADGISWTQYTAPSAEQGRHWHTQPLRDATDACTMFKELTSPTPVVQM